MSHDTDRLWKLHTFKRTPRERRQGLQAWSASFTLPNGLRGIGSGFTERTAVARAAESALRLESSRAPAPTPPENNEDPRP